MSRKFVPKKKKIEAEKAKEKPGGSFMFWIKSNPTRFVIVLFIILAMTFSSILYAISFSGTGATNQQANIYNGVQFKYDQNTGFYSFNYNKVELKSNTVPFQDSSVTFNQTFMNAFLNATRIGLSRPYSQDQYEGVAQYTLNYALTNAGGYSVSLGFTNGTQTTGAPLLNCSAASRDFPVIIFKQANYSQDNPPQLNEYPNNYCLVINYDSYQTLFVQKDALMFYGLKIMAPPQYS